MTVDTVITISGGKHKKWRKMWNIVWRWRV